MEKRRASDCVTCVCSAKAARSQHSAGDDEESNPFTDDSEIDITQQELNEVLGSTATQDKNYIRFLTRVALAKDQVLRYSRWQDDCVLWVHADATLAPQDVPPCANCGGARKFEFQVLPQLLFYLQVDRKSTLRDINDKSCEWGTLVAYTCAQSCAAGGEYVPEFLFRQTPYTGA